ncbi:MAG: substrate-binding domain-containing protein [Lachnospiraceae bacterium]|nr:substrate-binding domain-containing protein [Lachnospiraceae bacterium]
MKKKLRLSNFSGRGVMLLLTLLFIFAQALTVCADDTAAASQAEAPRGTCRYAMSFINLTDPYNVMIASELQAKIMETGDEAVVLDANYSNKRQISQIRRMLAEGIDGLFIQPVNSSGIVEVLEEIRYAGVPVICLDKEPSDMTWVDSYCGTNQLQAGQVVAESLEELYPAGAKLLLLTREDDEVCIARSDSITNALFVGPFRILETVSCDGSRAGAQASVTKLLNEYPDTEVIVTVNDSMGIGALNALGEAEKENVRIISIGGSPDFKKLLAEGDDRLIGTAALSPAAIGNTAAGIMNALKEGQKLKSRYLVEAFLMTAENVGNYGVETWQ